MEPKHYDVLVTEILEHADDSRFAKHLLDTIRKARLIGAKERLKWEIKNAPRVAIIDDDDDDYI